GVPLSGSRSPTRSAGGGEVGTLGRHAKSRHPTKPKFRLRTAASLPDLAWPCQAVVRRRWSSRGLVGADERLQLTRFDRQERRNAHRLARRRALALADVRKRAPKALGFGFLCGREGHDDQRRELG